MMQLVQKIDQYYIPSLQKKSHSLLGQPTLNVGMIQGGTQNNIVPDSCSIETDRRTIPGESEASFKDEINQIAHNLDLSISWSDSKGVDCPPLETNLEDPLVKNFLGMCPNSEPEGVSYFCDAAVINQKGTPCVVFGPGNISQAHTEDEWIEIPSLIQAYQLLMRYIQSMP